MSSWFSFRFVLVLGFDGIPLEIRYWLMQEQPPMDETSFSNYLDRFVTKLTPQLPMERHDHFRKNADAAVKWLKSKVV